MELTIQISEELYQKALEVAGAENISVDQVLTGSFQRKVLEFEWLKEKASRGRDEDFRRVMDKVPAVPPVPGDEL